LLGLSGIAAAVGPPKPPATLAEAAPAVGEKTWGTGVEDEGLWGMAVVAWSDWVAAVTLVELIITLSVSTLSVRNSISGAGTRLLA
jgi:hypothetical protein